MANSSGAIIDGKRQWTLIVLGGVVGLVVGWIAWTAVLSLSQATFIVSIGQVQQNMAGGSAQQAKIDLPFLEDPSAFMERVRSPSFAEKLVERTGLAELGVALPARQYGGRGALSVRSLRPPSQGLANLIEIRISSLSSDFAEAAAIAASAEIVREHTELLAPFLTALKKRGELLQDQITQLQKSDELIAQRVNKTSTESGSDISEAVLLGTKVLSEKRALDLQLTAYESQIAILAQDTRKTMVLFAPAVSKPRKAWAFMAPIAGAVSGMIFMFLALRVWQEIAARRDRVLASEVD